MLYMQFLLMYMTGGGPVIFIEPGVTSRSEIFFHIPTEFARDTLFFLHNGGHYWCEHPYKIQRDYLDLYIIFLILDGEMDTVYRGEHHVVGPNSILLIDCKQPHTYLVKNKSEMKWFHFSGNGSQNYANLLYGSKGFVFPDVDMPVMEPLFDQIISMMRANSVNEHRVSVAIHQILGELASPSSEPHQIMDQTIRAAIDFIEKNLEQPLTIDQIAASVNLSPFYFSRQFRKNVNCSPYSYLINARLKLAKQLLNQTTAPIDVVAEKCGFSSATHFIRAFRQNLSLTPGQFRQLRL